MEHEVRRHVVGPHFAVGGRIVDQRRDDLPELCDLLKIATARKVYYTTPNNAIYYTLYFLDDPMTLTAFPLPDAPIVSLRSRLSAM